MTSEIVLNNLKFYEAMKLFGGICFLITFMHCVRVDGAQVLRLMQERAVVKFADPQYITNIQVYTGRRRRSEPYMTNITSTIHTAWGNNVTSKIAYVLPTGNTIDFSIRICDVMDKPWMLEFVRLYSNLTDCPVPAGRYGYYNIVIPPKNFPLPLPPGMKKGDTGKVNIVFHKTGNKNKILLDIAGTPGSDPDMFQTSRGSFFKGGESRSSAVERQLLHRAAVAPSARAQIRLARWVSYAGLHLDPMMNKAKTQGLVSDLMPNIKLMQMAGHFLFNYVDESNGMSMLLRKAYSCMHAFLIVLNFACMGINMAQYSEEVNELTANTITVLFFVHTIIKMAFFAINSKSFYRTLAVWNQSNSHPLFTESDARYHQISVQKTRRLLYLICGTTVLSVVSWITLTFFGESVRFITDKESNDTLSEPAPRLPLKAWYPFDAMSGTMYVIAFVYQIYWLLFSMAIANLMDVMFCSWLIFACEQLQHLKAIMKPLMELSAALDTYRPNTAELFRASSTEKSEKVPDPVDMDIRGIYSTQQDFGMMLRGAGGKLQNFNAPNPNNPNGLTQKQEMLARSAIKYWVERHKHVVRLVASIGDTYGTALLFHMLVSTITLTLLAYQATKIDGLNVYAFSTVGYLSYTLGQVFHFCIFGNRLIEESSSVMEAAYSCQWYDGSEEAKTFVQIVCQQCQKAMSISGAKFFTVSLDLFASVLGAVVTYFMVLVQLK